MNLSKKLLSGSAIQLSNLLLEILIGFLLVPFLITNLTPEKYGLWILVMSMVSFLGLLTLGLSSAVQRYLSVEISSGNVREYKQTISSSLFVFILTGILCVLISIGLGLSAQSFVENNELSQEFRILILLMGCNVAVKFIATPFRAALTAEFKFILVSGTDILVLLIKSLLTIYFVLNEFGVIAVGLAILIGEASGNILLAIITKLSLKDFIFSIRDIKKSKVATLFKYSVNSFIASIGDMFRFPIDNIIISTHIGLSAVTIYSIPVRLLSYASAFILQTLGVLQPLFAKLHAEGNLDNIRSKFQLSNYLSFGIGSLLASGLIIFGADFITLWIDNYDETQVLTWILPLTLLCGVAQQPSVMLLYALGAHRYYAFLNIIEAICNVIISLALVSKFGVIGVAIGTLIPMFITKVLILPRYVCKQVNIENKAYYLIMLKSFTFCLCFTVIALGIKPNTSNWLELLPLTLIYAFVYVVCFILIVVKETNRNLLINYLKAGIGK